MKRMGLALLAALLAAGAGTAAQAQEKYPSKPVKILVPYAPGGATDIVSRILGEHMGRILGQQFVTENKPGAFGIIAIEEMARAKPDGYTLMIGNVTTNAITPVISANKMGINYDKEKMDLAEAAQQAAKNGIVSKDIKLELNIHATR